ncbi:hypothetical protein QTI51_09710 [Variovorax sp. J22G73]|uniref:hypothetical protein n=1 Tax=unclassified Variovorax TaxID=663243 RepID=UPI002578E3BF|nr:MULTISPECIES: hypothetical protein [unclassified Variovorax]MDM0006424.1 hypothetical protein [Variovorax sp. J22R203]MDM0097553.1 hypothetical protein [Variovorax sp. J22G73]
MIVYEAHNAEATKAFGTLAEAHEWCKSTCESVFRGGCRITQADVATDKANILRLLNAAGGTHVYTGRQWKLTNRGGLTEIQGEDE